MHVHFTTTETENLTETYDTDKPLLKLIFSGRPETKIDFSNLGYKNLGR